MIPRLIEALVSMRAKPPVVTDKIYLVAITTAADSGQPPAPWTITVMHPQFFSN